MTVALQARKVAEQIARSLPGVALEADGSSLQVPGKDLLAVAGFLKSTPDLDMDYLSNLTAVDFLDYFEVVYFLSSLKHNHSLTLKVKCFGRDNPEVPSVVGLWRSADFQEREVYDLLGVRFSGRPDLRRILLWEGYQGHPLRRDYL